MILENLLLGWQQLAPADRLTVVTGDEPGFRVPEGVHVERVEPPVGGMAGSLWCRTVGVRRTARRLGADAVISAVTASALLGVGGVPRGVVLTDLRHELRPQQFSGVRRLTRRATYAWSFGLADGIFCISERTLADLVRSHPRAGRRAVAARCGSDHVDAWPAPAGGEAPYALAFGQFANKNVDAVLDAWAEFCRDEHTWQLRLVGMGAADRASAEQRVARLGIGDRVQLMPWLDDDAFVECFSGAGLVLFPSDFEGFGLPVVEAMRLGIPVVVSDDPALLEVTGGHAEVADSLAPSALASCIRRALARGRDELDAARRHTDAFTWRGMAFRMRSQLSR